MYLITKYWPFASLTSRIVLHGSRKEKKVALTFDDGPSEWTIPIAHLLGEYDARETFYLLGNRIFNHRRQVRYLIENGHEIGNHSFDHPAMAFMPRHLIEKQLKQTDSLLSKML